MFQKRPQIKAVENKVSIIKQNVLKRSASNYQQSQSHTLANFDKKMKLTQDIQEQPLVSTQSSDPLIIIDDDLSTPKVSGKFDCFLCNKKFKTSQAIYQHKKTNSHKELV